MPSGPATSPISDELLTTAVCIKREAGAASEQIQQVIEAFARQDRWTERTGGIGFPQSEDVPDGRRPDFLAALFDLALDSSTCAPAIERFVSVNEIWPSRV